MPRDIPRQWGNTCQIGSLEMAVPELSASALMSRRILLGALLGLLLTGCLVILKPFLAPIIWAAILAYVTWPVYRRARTPLGRLNGTAAFLMTLLVSCAVVLPFIWLLVLLQDEFVRAYRLFTDFLSQGPHTLPPALRNIPWLGRDCRRDWTGTRPTLQLWAANSLAGCKDGRVTCQMCLEALGAISASSRLPCLRCSFSFAVGAPSFTQPTPPFGASRAN